MSATRTAFEAAVKAKDWKTAYNNFRILNMEEMCRSLYGLSAATREEFWGQRMANLNFPVELPRWEYAFTVATYHVLPANLWDPNATDQQKEAEDFLKSIGKKKKATRLDQNLGYSMQAVNYVLTTLHVKGANWDKYRGEPSWEKGTAPKDALDICVYDTTRPDSQKEIAAKGATTILDQFRIMANNAKKNACGNCGENSVLAFMFLYDMGVRPIDRMGVDKDHAFVVIGRKTGDANDFKSWGPDAAVCDPWAQGFRYNDISSGTYAGTQFETRMTGLVGKFKIATLYREG
jgi:hypothetical protein